MAHHANRSETSVLKQGSVLRVVIAMWWLWLWKRLSSRRASRGALGIDYVLTICGIASSGFFGATAALGTCASPGQGPIRQALAMGARGHRIGGTVAPGWEPVREAFRRNFELGLEAAAQFCVYHRGVLVVDLFGSLDTQRRYDGDSLQRVNSCTKVIESLAVAIAADKQLLDYNAPISQYWPEFASGPTSRDKASLTVGDLMRHQAGLDRFDDRISQYDLEHAAEQEAPLARKIERSRVIFPKRTRRAYHGTTRGLVVNELLRRVHPNGWTVGRYLQEVIAGPLGVAKSCHVGTLPEMELDRVAPVIPHPILQTVSQLACVAAFNALQLGQPSVGTPFRVGAVQWARLRSIRQPDSSVNRMMAATMPHSPNAPWVHRVEMPSSNGICNARGLARIAACLAGGGELDGVRIISEDGLNTALGAAEEAYDDGVGMTTVNTNAGWADFSQAAFDARSVDAGLELGSNPMRGFIGWGGFGGSITAFNVADEIGVAYCMTAFGNPMWCDFGMSDPRCLRLFEAMRECQIRMRRATSKL